MGRPTALVFTDSGAPPYGLVSALDRLGMHVRCLPSADANRPDADEAPAAVLISASLGLQQVALLGQRFAATTARVLVFPEDDLTALEACARAGFEYVTAPFLPGLLSNRLISSHERGHQIETVELMAVEALLNDYERDLTSAQEIQVALLPDVLPAPPGWQVAKRFRPARQVAGDFYDCFELLQGLRLGFLVADVCDKGLSAALFMALSRTLLRHTAEQAGSWSFSPLPGGDEHRAQAPTLSIGAGPLLEAVTATNRYLVQHHLNQGYFVTLFFGVLDPASGRLLFVNGGHNPPVLLRAGGGHEWLQSTGPALGMISSGSWSMGMARLEPGDDLLVYTDGVVEARSPDGTMFGMDGILQTLDRGAESAEAMLSGLDRALDAHAATASQYDDITMLLLRRLPQPVAR